MAYISEYSDLGSKEKRQLFYKRRYKKDRPSWDDSMELLKNELATRLGNHHLFSVLDAGCGRANYVIDELADIWDRKVGVDLAGEHTAGNTTVDEIIHASLSKMPFADHTFDAAVSLWVLEHIENAEAVFAEISRVLKPGGSFAFATPNAKSALIKARKMMKDSTAKKLVYSLYGREEADIFPVRYQANTMQKIQELAAQSDFSVAFLEENTDPSYTSFDTLTYTASKWASAIPHPLFRPHLVGILKKNL